MNDYRFILDRKSKKFHCPDCSKITFVKYIDTNTGEYLPDHYGRCDREMKCTYHLNPYKDGFAKMIWVKLGRNGNYSEIQMKPQTLYKPQAKQEIKEPAFIPYEILKATRKGYEQNIFIQNLLHQIKFPFDVKDIEQVIKLYNLGTICKGYRSGAITFPFIDIKGNVRGVQVKQFDETNHTINTSWLHSISIKYYNEINKPFPKWLNDYLLNKMPASCLFGEHLLSKYQTNPIALVEAPKTAIIGTLYKGLPENPKDYLWLAVYNVSSLSIEKCKVLQGRKVVLFPDLSKTGKTFQDWSDKAKQFQKEMPGTIFKVSDLIESLAPNENKNEGEDIADFLTRIDWKEFRKITERENLKKPVIEKLSKVIIEEIAESGKGEKCEAKTKHFIFPEQQINTKSEKSEKGETETKHFLKCEDWSHELIELEKYFKTVSFPAMVQLNKAERINDVPLFIDTHFQTLNNYNGNKIFLPYLNRLKELKQLLSTNFN